MKSHKKKTEARILSELEGVCLGLVFRFQPCTAYRIRHLLKESPSSHWCASAGSVYPLLKRLESLGLLTTESDEDDGRGRKQLAITRSGRAALRAWVMDGTDPGKIAAIMDPVRSRTFFLDILSKAKQTDYLERLITRTRLYLEETRSRLDSASGTDDLYDQLGARGAFMATEAKLEWLKLVLREINRQVNPSDSA